MRRQKREEVRPVWGRLYALALLMLGVLAAVEAYVPAGAWRRTLEVLITTAAFAVMLVWVRRNRAALDMAGDRDAGFRRVVGEASGERELMARPLQRASDASVPARATAVVVLPRRRPGGLGQR